MSREQLNVYSGNVHCSAIADAVHPDEPWKRQVAVLVAAPSGAAARRALESAGFSPISRTEWTNFWGTTGNAHDVAVALSEPGRVFGRSLDGVGGNGDYVRLADDVTNHRPRLDVR